jgi:hypothetical protein
MGQRQQELQCSISTASAAPAVRREPRLRAGTGARAGDTNDNVQLHASKPVCSQYLVSTAKSSE